MCVRHGDDLHRLQAARQVAAAIPYTGKERARFFQTAVDQVIASLEEQKPSCKMGCSACCSMAIAVTAEEAQLLSDTAKERGVTINQQDLEEQRRWGSKDYGKSHCVILDKGTGACRLYDVRPMVCRRYAVTSDPAFCKPGWDQRLEPLPRRVVRVLVSLTHDSHWGLLPEKLSAARQRKPEVVTT